MDPNREKQERRRTKDRTVSELGEEVIADMISNGKSANYVKDNRHYLKSYIAPAVGDHLTAEVEPRLLDQIIRKLRDKPATANRVRAFIKRMFSLARRWGYRPDDPTIGMERYAEQARDRVLTNDEIVRLCEAMDESRSLQARDAAMLILLTGSRPQEVFSARWVQFDLMNRKWTKPSNAVKQRRDHVVMLSTEAMAIIVGIPRSCDAS